MVYIGIGPFERSIKQKKNKDMGVVLKILTKCKPNLPRGQPKGCTSMVFSKQGIKWNYRLFAASDSTL